MKIELWKTDWQNGGWVTDEASSVKSCEANLSEENRIKFVTDCAAISRGKDKSNNPEKRFKMLLKEAAPNNCEKDCEGKASRALEFCPVVLDSDNENHKEVFDYLDSLDDCDFVNKFLRFSYVNESEFWNFRVVYYTNLRALINAGVPYEIIPYNTKEELKDFKVVKVKAPYFVFAQIRTHCRISQIASSARVIEENELWLPSDIMERIKGTKYKKDLILDIKENWKDYSTKFIQNVLKDLGYKKEICQRYPNHAIYKQWVMAGWRNDLFVWEHFKLERGAGEWKNWTQKETKEVAKAISQIVFN